MRKFLIAFAFLVLCGVGLLVFAAAEARRDPVVRTARIGLPRWPTGQAPLRAVLISDIHIGTRAMDAARLDRIVTQINALKPDLVLIAGDMIFGHDPQSATKLGEAMVAPLSRLRARLGVVAVPGNHDHWTGLAVVEGQLRRAGITVLENQAIALGPLALGAVGDDFSGYADPTRTIAAMRALPGARVLLTHSPDIFPGLPADAPLLLAGHTHCGQVVLPLYGSVLPVSRFGDRIAAGWSGKAAARSSSLPGWGRAGRRCDSVPRPISGC